MRSHSELTPEEQTEAAEQVVRTLLTPEMIRHYPARLRARLDRYADAHEGVTFEQLIAANEQIIRAALRPGIVRSLRTAYFPGPRDVVIRLRSQARPPAQTVTARAAEVEEGELVGAGRT